MTVGRRSTMMTKTHFRHWKVLWYNKPAVTSKDFGFWIWDVAQGAIRYGWRKRCQGDRDRFFERYPKDILGWADPDRLAEVRPVLGVE